MSLALGTRPSRTLVQILQIKFRPFPGRLGQLLSLNRAFCILYCPHKIPMSGGPEITLNNGFKIPAIGLGKFKQIIMGVTVFNLILSSFF